MSYKAFRDPKRAPTHPGAVLREDAIPALDLPIRTVARHLGIARQTLHRILAEEAPVTPSMALRLGRLFGNGPALWLNMQSAYDLSIATQQLHDELKKIPMLGKKKAA